jgi:hypothetical protein
MKYKKRLYKAHKRLNTIRPRYILLFAVLLTIISGFALRVNYMKTIELKKAVEAADANNGDIEGALRKLRVHVYGHMNANLSSPGSTQRPIQLKHQYDTLIAAENERVKQANVAINQKATNICEAKHPGGTYNQAKITCIQEYIGANGEKPRDIPTEFYQFNFVSPRWSPDFAGLSIVVTILTWIVWLGIVMVDRLLVKRMEDSF